MKEDVPKWIGCCVAMFFLGGLLGAIIGGDSGQRRAEEDAKREAVKHHAARWVANPEGNPTFIWEDNLIERIPK